jgi:hypothetical protein
MAEQLATAHDLNAPDCGELPPDFERLRAVIAESQAQAAQGDVVPAEVLLDDIDRIFAER